MFSLFGWALVAPRTVTIITHKGTNYSSPGGFPGAHKVRFLPRIQMYPVWASLYFKGTEETRKRQIVSTWPVTHIRPLWVRDCLLLFKQTIKWFINHKSKTSTKWMGLSREWRISIYSFCGRNSHCGHWNQLLLTLDGRADTVAQFVLFRCLLKASRGRL